MRVIAIVNALTGALCVQEMVDQGDDVVAVVTDPSDPNPRQEPDWSVRAVALRNHISVLQPVPAEVNSPGVVERLRRLQPDLIVAMHYGVIFKRPILEIPPLGCVNIHPTRLPWGQGKTPSCLHMLMGDERNWITLHFIDPGVDTGDVIAQGSVPITADDTGHTSTIKLLREGHRIFKENLPLLREGRAPRRPQKEITDIPTLYYCWEPHFARIPWNQPAPKVALHVRALSHPKHIDTYSGVAYTHLAGHRVSIWQAQVAPARPLPASTWRPGQILGLEPEGLMVQTGEGAVIISDLDVEGAAPGLAGLLPLLQPGLPAVFG